MIDYHFYRAPRKFLIAGFLVFVLEGCQKDFIPETVLDIDGNIYPVVKLGLQDWLGENLRTTRYSDGTDIPYVNSGNWKDLPANSKALCFYDDDPGNKDVYGALYSWAAAMNGAASTISNPSRVQGVCPDGWHLPSVTEWEDVAEYLGGESIAGGKLKHSGTNQWESPNTGATNESGFSALPGGMIVVNKDTGPGVRFSRPFGKGKSGSWWTSSQNQNGLSLLYNSRGIVKNLILSNDYGASVRCVRNESSTEPHLPVVKTGEFVEILDRTVRISAQVISDGGSGVTRCGFIWSTDSLELYITSTVHSLDSIVDGSFYHVISNLKPGTRYYIRSYAANLSGDGFGDIVPFTTKKFLSHINFNPSLQYDSVKDQDGNVYKTIIIGNQTWMAENLKAVTFNDGKSIFQPNKEVNFYNFGIPDYRWCCDDPDMYKEDCGALYSIGVMYTNLSKLCPVGWHVPSNEEWSVLIASLGAETPVKWLVEYPVAGKMKETGFDHWKLPNTGATNESGFTALPAGKLSDFGTYGYYYSSNVNMTRQAGVDIPVADYLIISKDSENISLRRHYIDFASVRCLKNN